MLRERYIGQKVNIFCYKRAKQIDRKSLAATKVKRMKEQLDKLFDISSCSCEVPVLRCDAFAVQCKTENCQTRHIVCTCPPNKKVPLEDREYLKDQREKTGPKGSYQLGPIDKDAIKKYKRKSAEVERQSERQEQASPNISIQSSSSEGTTDDSFDPGRQPKGPYSLLKVPRYSMELIRGDVSSNLGAKVKFEGHNFR